MDCGHGIPRQYKATKFSEQNNHAQCKRCNGFEGGRMDEYAKQVNARYGEGTWDKLHLQSKQICKRGKFEIDIMMAHYKAEAQRIAKHKQLTI
jgi:hypothetical protein